MKLQTQAAYSVQYDLNLKVTESRFSSSRLKTSNVEVPDSLSLSSGSPDAKHLLLADTSVDSVDAHELQFGLYTKRISSTPSLSKGDSSDE